MPVFFTFLQILTFRKSVNIQIRYSKILFFFKRKGAKRGEVQAKSVRVESLLTCNNLFSCLTPNKCKSLFVSYKLRRSLKYVHSKYISRYFILSFISEKKKPNPTTPAPTELHLSRSNTDCGFSIKLRRMGVLEYNI